MPSPGAKVAITHDIAHVKVGAGSLQFNYDVSKGETNVLALPVSDGELAKMKSLKFWMQTDASTTIAVVLQEKAGGSYMAKFAAPKNQWQRAEISLSDFTLNTGPNDPKDPDNKLDPDQIANIAILDIGQILIQGDAAIAGLFGVAGGAHSLYISDFQATTDALPDPASLVIDNFSRPQIQWIGIGSPAMSIGTNKAFDGAAMKATYHVQTGGLAGLIRTIAAGRLAGTQSVNFQLAAEKNCKLMVQFEESGGGKYNAIIDVAGSSSPKPIEVLFKDLKAANDSHDSNGKFDPDQVFQLLLIDLSGAVDQLSQDNTLWIGKVSAKQ